jgi:hypothetical protein
MLPRLEWRTLSWNGIDWDYINKNVHVSMLDYVPEALIRFQHAPPTKPQHQPYPHIKPMYSATKQYAETIITSPPLSKEDKKYVQEVVSMFLYYARCVDSTMLTALGSIATQQANPTKNTMIKVKQFLDYASTHPNAIVTYQASDMVLAAHSDVSYLSEANAYSRAGGCFFMSSDTPRPHNNGAVLTIAQIIKAVMSLAAEAKIGALYIKLSGSYSCSPHLRILGASSTSHTNSNRQHNGARRCQQQRHEETKSHGHEVPLALGQNQSETIPTLLGTKQ